MHAPGGPLLVWLDTLSTLAFAKINCNSDVVIANLDDAREVREACEIITGDITLVGGFEDSINLDEMKKIARLSKVRGSLLLGSTGGLESLSFPSLKVVNGSLSLVSIDDLKHVDFISLEYVARLFWDTKNLKTFKMNGLKNMVEGRARLDRHFYESPIHADDDTGAIIDLDADWMPKMKDVTIGWEFMDAIRINVTEPDITLGGPNTSEMEIGSLELGKAGSTLNAHRSRRL
ncbi:hypothetical protein QQZ08_004039 [Neonectria magnoliae]|uniref:Receptor L-domain domain-containing protein n=1 Tax=Neonectria magnoliae TaxID=2732573 RepID=A0ABR1I795_9HYPO